MDAFVLGADNMYLPHARSRSTLTSKCQDFSYTQVNDYGEEEYRRKRPPIFVFLRKVGRTRPTSRDSPFLGLLGLGMQFSATTARTELLRSANIFYVVDFM